MKHRKFPFKQLLQGGGWEPYGGEILSNEWNRCNGGRQLACRHAANQWHSADSISCGFYQRWPSKKHLFLCDPPAYRIASRRVYMMCTYYVQSFSVGTAKETLNSNNEALFPSHLFQKKKHLSREWAPTRELLRPAGDKGHWKMPCSSVVRNLSRYQLPVDDDDQSIKDVYSWFIKKTPTCPLDHTPVNHLFMKEILSYWRLGLPFFFGYVPGVCGNFRRKKHLIPHINKTLDVKRWHLCRQFVSSCCTSSRFVLELPRGLWSPEN